MFADAIEDCVLEQAKAAVQATAAAEASSQLAVLAQQQQDIKDAMKDQQQQIKAAQRSIEDLEAQKHRADSELNGLLSKVPELSDMMSRWVPLS